MLAVLLPNRARQQAGSNKMRRKLTHSLPQMKTGGIGRNVVAGRDKLGYERNLSVVHPRLVMKEKLCSIDGIS
jgi:hypothetical protein